MKMKNHNPDPPRHGYLAFGSVAIAFLILLSGCAGMAKTPEEAVRERARERLDLILADDFAAAYEYLSPGYRSGVSSANYQRRMLSQKAQWRSATVGKSECSDDVCKIRISIDYSIYGVVPGVDRFDSTAAAVEDWVKADGKWYFVPKN